MLKLSGDMFDKLSTWSCDVEKYNSGYMHGVIIGKTKLSFLKMFSQTFLHY